MICLNILNIDSGQVKIWISFGVNGKIGLSSSLGVAGQTGIEVTFDCKSST